MTTAEAVALETFTEESSQKLADAYMVAHTEKHGTEFIAELIALIGPILVAIITKLLDACKPTPAQLKARANNPGLLYRLAVRSHTTRVLHDNPDVSLDPAIVREVILKSGVDADVETCKKMLAVSKMVS